MKLKAIFTTETNSNLVGVTFHKGKEQVQWDALTRDEQVKILNGWMQHYNFLRKFLKPLDKEPSTN